MHIVDVGREVLNGITVGRLQLNEMLSYQSQQLFADDTVLPLMMASHIMMEFSYLYNVAVIDEKSSKKI